MNPRRNIARRDPEQDTNRVDPKHVQKTQPSENDKVMLSDTEKAVALRHEEPEDLALIYKPHDEANERLKAKVLLNFCRKFDVSSLHATCPAWTGFCAGHGHDRGRASRGRGCDGEW